MTDETPQPEQDPATRTRTVTWSDPAPYVQQGFGMRPLDYLSKMLAGEIPPSPIAQLMGMSGVEIEAGRAVFSAEPAEYHYNPIGVVHGALAATLLDSTMACAIHSMLPAGGYFSTLELHINYVRAVRAESGRLTCEGKVVHVGRTIATAEGRVSDPGGRLIAHGTCTCLLFRPPEETPAPAAGDTA